MGSRSLKNLQSQKEGSGGSEEQKMFQSFFVAMFLLCHII